MIPKKLAIIAMTATLLAVPVRNQNIQTLNNYFLSQSEIKENPIDTIKYISEIQKIEERIEMKNKGIKFLEEKIDSNYSPQRNELYNQKLDIFYKEIEELKNTKDSLENCIKNYKPK